VKDWLIARLKEPSTYRGLVWLLTACGISLAPDVWESITAVGMAIAGLLGVILKEPLPPIELVSVSQNEINAAKYNPVIDPYADRMHSPDLQPVNGHQEKLGINESAGWNG